jgi:beta-glucanase (GH16 family)
MDTMKMLRPPFATAVAAALAGVLVTAISPSAGARVPAGGYISPMAYPGYVLAWHDEFTGSALDGSNWLARTGPGPLAGQGSLQYDRPENLSLEDGYLVITARPETREGSAFASGSVTTKEKRAFRYGRIDVRARVPAGQGLWPSVRLLGNCARAGFCGEIDLMEMAGGAGREDTVYGTLRWPENRGQRYVGGSITLPGESFDQQFHVFSVTWDETRIRWLADDRLFLEQDITDPVFDVFRESFYLVISLAVGGELAGPPDASTPFPARFAIDYVRVFQPGAGRD